MKKIEIVGKNYSGEWKRMRTVCRVIILRENKILLSYETLANQWMIPGGGLGPNEDKYGIRWGIMTE